jgi:ribose 5-phosphate isomerase A
MSRDEAKKLAARAAAADLPPSGVLGLGSGSTAKFFIAEVGALVKAGRGFRGVPTSEASRRNAETLGIPLLQDEGPWDIDVTVDGADEVDDDLNLIKGGGAAHTREKIVNFASKKNVIVVDDGKLSRRLGEQRAVPVEVLRFAHLSTARALSRIGRAVLRARDGVPVMTDAGSFLYDVQVGPIADPAALDRSLRDIPGVVETGLFVGRASVVIVAGQTSVRRLTRT